MCNKSGSANPNRVVLPTNVTPSHYTLTVTPDLKEYTFRGYVEIKYVCCVCPCPLRADMLSLQPQQCTSGSIAPSLRITYALVCEHSDSQLSFISRGR